MANKNYSSTTEFDVSMIASMVISVIRDRSLSSAYGYYLSLIKDQTGSIAAPPLDDFFSSTVAKRLRLDMRRLGEESEHIVLYSDMGDLFSQLSRLLIACNERLADEEGIIVQADEKIGSLEFSRQVNDGSYIKHLRQRDQQRESGKPSTDKTFFERPLGKRMLKTMERLHRPDDRS